MTHPIWTVTHADRVRHFPGGAARLREPRGHDFQIVRGEFVGAGNVIFWVYWPRRKFGLEELNRCVFTGANTKPTAASLRALQKVFS